MTYKELAAYILFTMTPKQQENDVTIFDGRDEFMPMKDISIANPEMCDVLDPGHPFLTTL
ncbi:MAG: hypothetical protein DRP55_07745 [Spirochaetes bacterium]|nr:MAG: hypothetical protein DRP55_07745 [Spirochaetota bacterium]